MAKAKRVSVEAKKAAKHPDTKRTRSCPTSGEVAAFVGAKITPRLKPQQIQRLRKALPGYANQLDDVAELYEAEGESSLLSVRAIRPADLLDIKARQRALAAREAVLEAAYRSVYEQRLQVDDEAMGMLNAIVKRVQQIGADEPEILVRWKSILSFFASFRTGGRPPKAAARPGAGPTDPAAGT